MQFCGGKSSLYLLSFIIVCFLSPAFATTTIPFTINMSEAVVVSGTPRVSVSVGGLTRYANYTSGSGTSALVFNYNMVAGDVDLDGVTLISPLDLNGGTLRDLNGNDATLTFTIPNTSNVRVNYPSLGMDFIADADGRYTLNGIAYNNLPTFLTAAGGTFSRASTATYFDSSGTLQTAASGSPRFDYNPSTLSFRGLLIERGSTNFIRNSQFSGITTGSYNSNTSLSNWDVIPSGGQISILSTGTQNGIPFLNIRFNYSNASGTTRFLNFTPTTASRPTVTSGTSSILSAWLGVTAYSSTGGTCVLNLSNRSYTSGGGYISEQSTPFTAITPYALRTTPSLTHGATAGLADGWIYVTVPNGVNCDLTVRFGAPQFELAATPTSYIPTSGTTVIRAAENLTIPTGGWYSASEGTITADALNGTNTTTVGITSIDNSASTSNNRMTLIRTGTTNLEALINNGGVTQFQTTIASNGNNLLNKMGFGYQANSFRQAVNTTLGTLDTTGTLPTVNQLRIGVWAGTAYFDGWIQKVKYYPLRVTDTQLQLLTQ
jgi:hypothetical protein